MRCSVLSLSLVVVGALPLAAERKPPPPPTRWVFVDSSPTHRNRMPGERHAYPIAG